MRYDQRLSAAENRRLAIEHHSREGKPMVDPEVGTIWFPDGAWAARDPNEWIHEPSDHEPTRLQDIAFYWKLRMIQAFDLYDDARVQANSKIAAAKAMKNESMMPTEAEAEGVESLRRNYMEIRRTAEEAATRAGVSTKGHGWDTTEETARNRELDDYAARLAALMVGASVPGGVNVRR